MPKVSFIVPVYGVEKYLRTCLDSIAAQTMGDFEAILIDDGSPDKSGEICDEYAREDPRFVVVHKKNEGVSVARNVGIDMATGEWAYFVDSDDWIDEDAAARLYEAGTQNDVDVVMSHCERVYSSGKQEEIRQFCEPFLERSREGLDELQRYVLYQPYSSHYAPETNCGFAAPWGKFCRMALIKGADEERPIYFEPSVRGVFDDGIWSLWVLERATSVLALGQRTYYYRIVDSSLTGSFHSDAMLIQQEGYRLIEEFLVATNKSIESWEAYWAHVVAYVGRHLSLYFFHPQNPSPATKTRRELITLLRQEPFCTAARRASKKRLRLRDRYLAFAQRHAWYVGLRAYALAQSMARRIR